MTRQRDGSFVFLPIPYFFSSNTIRVLRLPARKCNTKSVFDEHNAFSRGANNPEGADKGAKTPEGADKWRGRHGRANVRKARKAEESTDTTMRAKPESCGRHGRNARKARKAVEGKNEPRFSSGAFKP